MAFDLPLPLNNGGVSLMPGGVRIKQECKFAGIDFKVLAEREGFVFALFSQVLVIPAHSHFS
jgi:hypothetical protein